MYRFQNLSPVNLWKNFDSILNIPRPSKKEEKLIKHIQNLASEKNIPFQADAIGNLVLKVPASKGFEHVPCVILQGHLDMVTEKNNDHHFDFNTDPIPAYVDGDWVRSKGTTLGADNGIGVSAALALIEEENFIHGPLELLFTIDEETGLTGATNLATNLLTGKILLNLDSEDEGIICIGCAGGSQARINLNCKQEEFGRDYTPYKLTVKGLQGGHSGINIIENRGNANKLLARLMLALSQEIPFKIADIDGGTKHNAIPREAEATLLLPLNTYEKCKSIVQKETNKYLLEFHGCESNIDISLNLISEKITTAYTNASNILNLMLGIPSGVFSMSRDIPGLVETSSNLAIVKAMPTGFQVKVSVRSSVSEAMDSAYSQIAAVVNLAGAEMEIYNKYPGWRPNTKSPLLKRAMQIWQHKFGKEPTTNSIHAGLESGVILEKYPGIDIISFGPDIRGAHSPSEAVSISSCERFYDYLKGVLTSLAQQPL